MSLQNHLINLNLGAHKNGLKQGFNPTKYVKRIDPNNLTRFWNINRFVIELRGDDQKDTAKI